MTDGSSDGFLWWLDRRRPPPEREAPAPEEADGELLYDGDVDVSAGPGDHQWAVNRCPRCRRKKPRVVRTVQYSAHIKRDVVCVRCHHRWPTFERLDEDEKREAREARGEEDDEA